MPQNLRRVVLRYTRPVQRRGDIGAKGVEADLRACDAALPAIGVEAVADVLTLSGILTVTRFEGRKEVLMILATDMGRIIQETKAYQNSPFALGWVFGTDRGIGTRKFRRV